MIGYVIIGTNDMGRSIAFYDALFKTVGIKQLWTHSNMAAWGASRNDPAFCIAVPFDGESATVGNGNMIALKMPDRNAVDRIHAKALELGGTDEGAAGLRGDHANVRLAGCEIIHPHTENKYSSTCHK